MNISQEILVLDFGDDRQSTDFLRSDKPGGTASEANFGGKKIISRLSSFFSFITFFAIFKLKDVNIDLISHYFSKKSIKYQIACEAYNESIFIMSSDKHLYLYETLKTFYMAYLGSNF